ncbi:MAG: transposase [Planctomycetota bacterium]|jgi:REP element-mobilizing transposase RayT
MFLHHLRTQLRRYAIDLIAYVVMSNHYHLVARCTPDADYRDLVSWRTDCRHRKPYRPSDYRSQVISQFAHGLQLAVSKELQACGETTGHLWEGRQHRRQIRGLGDLVVTAA